MSLRDQLDAGARDLKLHLEQAALPGAIETQHRKVEVSKRLRVAMGEVLAAVLTGEVRTCPHITLRKLPRFFCVALWESDRIWCGAPFCQSPPLDRVAEFTCDLCGYACAGPPDELI